MPNSEEFYVGRAVTSLQTMLRVIAAADPSLPGVIPDGYYGEKTVQAVRAFQRREGLPCTGTADEATWNAVRTRYEEAWAELSPAAPLELGLKRNQAILEGSDNLHVLLIQAMLHNLHEIYANMPDCRLSGVCDAETAQAIRALQHCCGMQESGILDKRLWRLLAGLYHQAVGNGIRTEVCPKTEK